MESVYTMLMVLVTSPATCVPWSLSKILIFPLSCLFSYQDQNDKTWLWSDETIKFASFQNIPWDHNSLNKSAPECIAIKNAEL